MFFVDNIYEDIFLKDILFCPTFIKSIKTIIRFWNIDVTSMGYWFNKPSSSQYTWTVTENWWDILDPLATSRQLNISLPCSSMLG